MKLTDLLRTAFLNLWRRKLRAFLHNLIIAGHVPVADQILHRRAGKLRQRLRNQLIGAPARRCDLNLMQLRHTYFPTPSAVVSVGSFTFLSAASFLSLKNKYHTANKIAPTTTQQSAKLNTYGKNSTWM